MASLRDDVSDAKAALVEGDGRQTREQKSAWARKTFVAALAGWVNMHDLHEPFANGPPSAEQSCAVLEHALMLQQTVPSKDADAWPRRNFGGPSKARSVSIVVGPGLQVSQQCRPHCDAGHALNI